MRKGLVGNLDNGIAVNVQVDQGYKATKHLVSDGRDRVAVYVQFGELGKAYELCRSELRQHVVI